MSRIPDAVPMPHNGSVKANPYTVLGKTYYPMNDARAYRMVGTASWYGTKFHGQATANGETYDLYGMTAAHKTLPLPSYVRVTNLDNGKSVIVRVNDRGPFYSDRVIDLSFAAAKKLGYAETGTAGQGRRHRPGAVVGPARPAGTDGPGAAQAGGGPGRSRRGADAGGGDGPADRDLHSAAGAACGRRAAGADRLKKTLHYQPMACISRWAPSPTRMRRSC